MLFAKKTALILLAGLVVAANAHAFINLADNGYLGDWGVTPGLYGASDWIPTDGIIYEVEDQIDDFLGPGRGGQNYDAEAIYWTMDQDTVYLAVVTGMSPSGVDTNGPGDIFLNFGAGRQYGVDVSTGKLYKNPSWIEIARFGGISNPITIDFTKPAIDLGDLFFTYSYAYPTGQHYVMEMGIPKSLLGNDWMYGGLIHWTQTCGNDVIELETPVIPEPVTMVLFGLGGIGLGFLKRRKTKKRMSN